MTSDGGLILIRELHERPGLEKPIEKQLSDLRLGLNKQFTRGDLLRQSVYSRLAAYEDLNNSERLAADPTFRLISPQRICVRGAALTSTLPWFETERQTQEENLIRLITLNRETLGQAECLDRPGRVALEPALVTNFVAFRVGGAYDVRDRGPNRKFRPNPLKICPMGPGPGMV